MKPDEYKPFFLKAREIAELIRENCRQTTISVISHYDADGMASALILLRALKRLGAHFQLRIIDQLDELEIKKSLSSASGLIIFSDLGSGYLNIIGNELKKRSSKKVVILDHHEPETAAQPENVFEFNPHKLGFNGSTSASSSTLSFLTALTLDRRNIDSAVFMAAGALGDRQDCGERKSLCFLNKHLVDIAMGEGELEVKLRPALAGSSSTPIVRAIANTVEPYIPELTGDEAKAYAFLESIGVDPLVEGRLRTMGELTEEEIGVLTSMLIEHLLAHGVEASEAEKIFAYDYLKPGVDILSSGRELASFLNACGRLRIPWYAFKLFVKGWPTREEVEHVQSIYRSKIAEYLEWISNERESFRVLDNVIGVVSRDHIDDRFIGLIVSLSMSLGLVDTSRVIAGFAHSRFRKGLTKVSCRASKDLVRRGVDLGKAVKVAASSVGGIGGGHDAAAGAQIPRGKEEEFLSYIDKVLGAQIAE